MNIHESEGVAVATWAHPLPGEIAALAAGAVWEQITIGLSGSYVYRLAWPDRPERPALYLKIAPPALRGELLDEQARLNWLHTTARDIPVPLALASGGAEPFTYLALTEAPGVMSCDVAFAADVPLVARLLGEGMRQLHAVDATRCPFDRRIATTLALAAQRLADGQVDVADFDDDSPGPNEALAWLQTHIPADEDLVFTHGDYCLPNVLIDPVGRRVSGFIDWSRAGVADRYQDLALATRSLAYNFGPGGEPLLWEAYGIPQPDRAKLRFYRMLDEFL